MRRFMGYFRNASKDVRRKSVLNLCRVWFTSVWGIGKTPSLQLSQSIFGQPEVMNFPRLETAFIFDISFNSNDETSDRFSRSQMSQFHVFQNDYPSKGEIINHSIRFDSFRFPVNFGLLTWFDFLLFNFSIYLLFFLWTKISDSMKWLNKMFL